MNFKLLGQIFTTFLKISPVTFGGGYAMIPHIEREIVEKRKWIDTKDITDVFALAGVAPGAIGVNSAIFIGYRLAGVSGALAALLGMLLPTFIVVVLLSLFYLQVQDNSKVAAALNGIKASIVALISYAAYRIGRTAAVDKMTLLLIAASVATLCLVPIHPALLIVIGAILGMAIVWVRKKIGIATRFDKDEMQYKYEDYYIGEGI